MSINTQILRIKNNIENAYTAIGDMGGIIPSVKNSNNLSSAIDSIPVSSGNFLTISNSERELNPGEAVLKDIELSNISINTTSIVTNPGASKNSELNLSAGYISISYSVEVE